jgi:chemotaxis methyl-accepting protein methylase
MASLAYTPMAYRHVVFPDAPQGNGYAFNFSPRPRRDPGLPAGNHEELTADERACVRWLFDRAELQILDYRFETLKRRIPACLRALRVESVGQVRAALERQPELLKPAISALVIGVTSFFRDPQVFSALEQTGLVEVLARSARPRIWSVGCSDGAELYSVAMLLAERAAVESCTMLGTDCRSDALQRARAGCYDATSLKNVPGEFVGRYFKPQNGLWQVHPFLRAAAQWRQGDAIHTSEPATWDLILCRNMAIYLQPAAAGRLWERLGASLRRGGILVTGKAERPYGAAGLRAVAPCIYQRDRS